MVPLLRSTLGCFLLFLPFASHGFSLSNPLKTAIVAKTRKSAASPLPAIKFHYSPSSLQHLAVLETTDNTLSPTKSSAYTWSAQKSIAAVGALVGAAGLTAVGKYTGHVFGETGDLSFFFSSVGGALGWALLGGAQVRQDELPVDGGADAKFVVDRPARLRSILEQIPPEDIVTSDVSNSQRDVSRALKYIQKVHGRNYLSSLKGAVENAKEIGRVRRLVPSYARTLIDENSYESAVQGVADWLDAVDNNGFALVRPPSHHACREKGMGGCLLNGAAAAAYYALEKYDNVAVLDFDAHFGNGIAHCVQDEPRLRYCSLHEEAKSSRYWSVAGRTADDPRGPEEDDRGPLGNCANLVVPSGATWETYKDILENKALPFCQEADFLIVAAGFDALEADQTSGICLSPQDYRKLGSLLHKEFGNRVAFGLEGGYCWENGDLAQAVLNLVEPWSH